MLSRTTQAVCALPIVILAACADGPGAKDPVSVDWVSPTSSMSAGEVPSRKSDPKYTFVHMSDDSLWTLVAQGDGTAVVGLKAPGANRGEFQGRVLLTRSERRQGVQALLALPGVTVEQEHGELPIIRVKVTDAASFSLLRALPFVDYAEPARLRSGVSYSTGGWGCSYTLASGRTMYYPGGDVVPVTYGMMGITNAWRRSSGSGKTVGLTDTGIYFSSEQMVRNVRAGQSGSRRVTYTNSTNYQDPYIGDDGCSHGTRMAGVITAPKDDSGPVGVAWGANFVGVRHNDDVGVFDTYYAGQAIRIAAENGSDIIAMAWGSPDYWFNSIEAEIKHWYYNHDKLFIGAAGTDTGCANAIWRHNAFFPAEMGEVMAVTAIDDNGKVSCDSHYGPSVELVSYINQPTTGRYSDVVSIRASSNATAVIAGAAALVWSYYGGTRQGVVQRLKQTARNPWGTYGIGSGVIDVARAMGILHHARLPDYGMATGDEPVEITVQVSHSGGTGPFRYYWSNGSVTSVPYTTYRYHPVRDVAHYSIHVTVEDTYDGATLGANGTVTLWPSDPSGCPSCAQ
ncbi:MAG TPA: S8/S53 family peptidase [Longimicrobiaceae bacterium]|nr:S8/S53 family peptidase [Longimicrobiaceae bacterium]